MSGALVGLVRQHGPRDHNAWAVLTVIAEDLHGPTKAATLSNDMLAEAARLSLKTVKRAVKVLVADGWVARVPGQHKGVASTYLIRLDAFPADAVERLLGQSVKGVTQAPSPDSPAYKGGHTDPLYVPKGVTQSTKGVTQAPPTVPVSTPSSGSPPTEGGTQALVEAEEDVLRTALQGLPTIPWKPALKAALGAALAERGHTATSVNRFLIAHYRPNGVADPYAVIFTNLQAIPPAAAEAPVATGPCCHICSFTEAECKRREATSGHTFSTDRESASR